MFPISQSTVPEIDEVLAAMTDADAGRRLRTTEALARLRAVVYSVAPESLLMSRWCFLTPNFLCDSSQHAYNLNG